MESNQAYAALCGRLGCDARVGLSRRDVYKLFEKAPQSVWEDIAAAAVGGQGLEAKTYGSSILA